MASSTKGLSPKVFIVDDDPSVRSALSRLVRSVGLDVEAFASSREFLDHAWPQCPGCLVLDIRLPGLSGLDLQKELAAAGKSLPIVFITGHGSILMSVQAMKAGAVDFLEKPFDDQELLDAIHMAIERDRATYRERTEKAEIQKRVQTLTPREREVFSLVVTGLLNKQIGAELGTTEKTVKVHRARVMQKMKVGSLAELVRVAARADVPQPKV